MSEKKQESFFAKIHNPGFTWHDFILILFFVVILMEFAAEILGTIAVGWIPETNGFLIIFKRYFMTIGTWIAYLMLILLFKKNKPIFRALTPEAKGNTWKMLLLGLIVGFAQNFIVAVGAILNGDIALSYGKFEIFPLLALLGAVFIQSSSEELVCRGFLYQRIKRGYRHPAWRIVGNSALFAALHLLNPSVGAIPIINLILVAILYSLIVYYFDSIWFCMAAHASWNWTQNILLGLPNSGLVSNYSFMQVDAANAQTSFFYDPGFGIEGSVCATLVILISIAVVVYFGKKRNQPELDVWAKQELSEIKTEGQAV